MGKNKKALRKQNNKTNSNGNINLPNVSICTPTFNRRPFFKGLIESIKEQDYPHNKIEWIIVDDGTDCIKDIFESEETKEKLKEITIRYFYVKEKMDLGKKRNYMHKKCKFTRDEDIIVYMDDDDYYPPERVSHSVQKLRSNPNVLCGGSSELYLWFNTLNKMYKFGPYGPNHATAGTFAFKRKLLKETSYEDEAVLAEEKHFLKNYTIPFIQFNPMKTILVVSHEQNTFDKRRLISDQNKFCKESGLKVKSFIKNKDLLTFYNETINEELKKYEPGDVKNKPKVLEEIERKDKMRKEMHLNRPTGLVGQNELGERKDLTIREVTELLVNKDNEIKTLKLKLTELFKLVQNLNSQNMELMKQIKKDNDISGNDILENDISGNEIKKKAIPMSEINYII